MTSRCGKKENGFNRLAPSILLDHAWIRIEALSLTVLNVKPKTVFMWDWSNGYDACLPSRRWEFDSPIPHQLTVNVNRRNSEDTLQQPVNYLKAFNELVIKDF